MNEHEEIQIERRWSHRARLKEALLTGKVPVRSFEARFWSNEVLRTIAPHVRGDVINVSAGNDHDKQGGHYREYFSQCTSYAMSNFRESNDYGFRGRPGEIPLDLEAPLDPPLERAFDCVFNHTTLEHIWDVHEAYRNLAIMSRDLVLVVVPFIQGQHERPGSYLDYWRMTPSALRRLANESGLTTVGIFESPMRFEVCYLFSVASRNPEQWTPFIEHLEQVEVAGDWPGRAPQLAEAMAFASLAVAKNAGLLLASLKGWRGRR